MKTRYMTILTTLVFLGFTVSAVAKGKPPPPGPDPVVEYEAALVSGAFRFGAVDVTLNKKGNTYSSTVSLDMVRPFSEDVNGVLIDVPSGQLEWSEAERDQWDAVFAVCPELFSGNLVGSVMASDNWSIDNAGGKKAGKVGSNIRISFRDVSVPGFPGADLDFALIGVLDDELPPASGSVSVELTKFNFFGAGEPPIGCSSGTQPLLFEQSVLEITQK